MKSRLHHAAKCSTTKCVRIVGQGVPVRLSNDDAFRIVHADKAGEYCTRKFFRDWHAATGTYAGISRLDAKGRIVNG